MKKYYYSEYNNLKTIIKFELTSLLGRTFKKNKSKIKSDGRSILLDIGAGNNFTEGWLHADFYSFRLKFWKKYEKVRLPEIELDLRYPLQCNGNSIDGVYSSHTLEHLDPDDAIRLLNEIFRILKPNCFLRIIVPDIEKAVNFYTHKDNDLQGYETGCEAISDFTQNWGHKSAWDEVFLTKILGLIGFQNIKKVEYGTGGNDKRLIKETPDRKTDSLVIEAQKGL
jgi:predicted SAM-dependent methyltransferase